MVVLRASLHPRREQWRALASPQGGDALVADCASEALTTEDELRRERSGVQCEAQASLSALRRELPPRAVAFAAAQLSAQGSVRARALSTLRDQASWVVASHKARFSGRSPSRTWL